MKPLGFLASGESGLVKEVAGGLSFRKKLNSLGIVRGKVIRMVQDNNVGPVIVALGEERLALGRGMVQKIFVDEIGSAGS